jgi:hypothetical protein
MKTHEINKYEFNAWIEHELAALKIQRCYRQWKVSFHSKRKWKIASRNSLPRHRVFLPGLSPPSSIPYCVPISSLTITNNQSNALFHECFQLILQEQATIQQQFHIWRLLLEMRKAYPYLHTDILIKALIECNGDHSKALILLSDPNYLYSFRQPTLTLQLRQTFLPHFTALHRKKKFSLGGPINTPSSSSSSRMKFHDDVRYRNTNVDVIRNLRSKHQQQHYQSSTSSATANSKNAKKEELLGNFMKVIEKTYFPYPIVANVHNPASSLYQTHTPTTNASNNSTTFLTHTIPTTTTTLPPPLREKKGMVMSELDGGGSSLLSGGESIGGEGSGSVTSTQETHKKKSAEVAMESSPVVSTGGGGDSRNVRFASKVVTTVNSPATSVQSKNSNK